ncbi:glutamate--tRNA ligase [Hyphococcus flavus]|uniref:Glutamate--tRNA ligase n=1 Tax=Hyphococcus flavus TaxID=1866326 RepID=A0AAE9ZE87_9PROT|nr:glutamate--tRNA ligase [Hyphococcus flavus]WDI31098.1 glutamate--tRNA ligase [Hyphococcus flavus]
MSQDFRSAAPVVTRFAPSPTGYLHIGGARTALFNWLYARGRGGKFLLRIEDTDRARHTEEAVAAIIDGLKWLGLDWDGDPVSQYSRRDRHAEIAEKLLQSGRAYRCYLTPDELSGARDRAKAKGVRFESPWREADTDDAPADKTYAIRFKAPRDGETVIEDAIQGRVAFPNSALDDLIILRSDGGPTYNLAVVVDDYDMGVTHVIRGDDHLNNAARQQQIYEALDWSTPVFGHVPLIHGQDGAKLSKRHGALGVEAYRDQGYLPEGLANYLLRLGWAHGDEEIIPFTRAKETFDLSGVNKAPARLDIDKLNHVNSHYIAELSDDNFVKGATPFLSGAGVTLDTDNFERLTRSASFLKSRCANLAEVAGVSEYLFLQRPLQIEGKAAKPLRKEGAVEILASLIEVLQEEAVWSSAEKLDETLKALVETKNIGFGALGQPARAALTAGRPSPGLGEVLYGLGREEALARLADQTA